ncbi:histidine kinase dimerization/phosphoacceptor domain -containing protein [Methylobacterium organophilum]|nr:histidine kinase dimerization/phosphoacceptor domain -containing protein [Methylobacterium organophilum]
MSDPPHMEVREPTLGLANLDALAAEALDRLDQGVIQLDAMGMVHGFNVAASKLLEMASEAAIGRNFFRDLFPSTAVPAFYGRFLHGVRGKVASETFEFVFGRIPRAMRTRVHLQRAADAQSWWLVIQPMETIGAGAPRDAVLAAIDQRTRAEPVDPSLCEREPIHIPGSIQPNAVMIAADVASLAVIAFSANVAEILPPQILPLDGTPLSAILPSAFLAALRGALAAGTLTDGRSMRQTLRLPGRDEQALYATAHAHLGRLILEFELAPERPEDFRAASPLDTELAATRLRGAETLTEVAQIAALEIRALTGFDSVLVYRFDTDWNGEAIAEDMTPDWQRPLIGLRFPASDIPAQARALYTKAKSRFVIDRDCVPVPLVSSREAGNGPIDLTFAQNRTLSPIHLEYQRNLGVDGSMSISIMVEERLWGLMIGHHRRPHYVAPETRAAATILTDAFAMRVQEVETRGRWAEQQMHLDVEGRLVRRLTRSDDFVQALTSGDTTLLDLFGVTGAGIVSGQGVHLIGTTPDAQQVLAIAEWVRGFLPADRTSFVTDALSLHHPPAAAYADSASGLLAAFVDRQRRHLLLWFKPEVPSTVTWGGDPRKPVLSGGGPVAVLPRRSFERWVEERSGFSMPWAPWKVALAEQLADAVEGVVLRQRRKIDELTGLLADKELLLAQKDLLTREIDHRVKNSLQIVSAFLQMQRRQVTDPAARQAFADTSARVMSVARVHDNLYQADSPEEVDLGQTIEKICNDLVGVAGGEHSIDLTAEPGLMVPYRKAVALSLIATELVTNAFKYAKSDGGAQVSVTVAGEQRGGVRLKVCDDGVGLPDGWESARSKGTGLGMKLIRAMLDQIEAHLEVENAPGACFTVRA